MQFTDSSSMKPTGPNTLLDCETTFSMSLKAKGSKEK